MKFGEENAKKPRCSFCGKDQSQVRKLVAGPSVFICDECIDLCNEIIEEELTLEPIPEEMDEVPKPKEIREVFINLED